MSNSALVVIDIQNDITKHYRNIIDRLNAAIDRAIAEAEDQGITGKAVTPFLLARVKELTGGDSLEANIALVKNNARLAARIAAAL